MCEGHIFLCAISRATLALSLTSVKSGNKKLEDIPDTNVSTALKQRSNDQDEGAAINAPAAVRWSPGVP